MRYILVMVLFSAFGNQVYSQNYEIGGFLGGANYIGDVGNSTYIRPTGLVYGGLIKWNQSDRHTFRFSLLFAEVSGDDAESKDTRRQARGYHFSNNIVEAGLGMEFTFWEYDPYASAMQSTPYIYSGLNYFYSSHFQLQGDDLEKAGNNWGFSIPMALGYKQTLNSFMSGGIEIGARYTFTDNLDGSQPSEVNGDFRKDDFGNPNTTDWYMFTGIYITFNFGRKPCYNF